MGVAIVIDSTKVRSSIVGFVFMLYSIFEITTTAFVPTVVRKQQLLLVHRRPPQSKNGESECFSFGAQQAITTIRRKAVDGNGNDNDNSPSSNNGSNSTDISKTNAIPEKIRWIFEDADEEFLEDDDYNDDNDDDSFFDDLFLTDDEESDGYSDDGGFITDDNDEDGPDASLNEDDLMELHDMDPDLQLAAPFATKLGAGNSSISSPEKASVSVIADSPAAITYTMAKNMAKTNQKNGNGTAVSLDNILASLESDLSYFYLRDELGISEDIMWKITNDAPSVLGLKAKNVCNKVRVLQSLVGFTDAEIRQLITSQPTLLQLSAKKNLSPTILYWIRQLQIGKKELKTLILGCPALLKYSRANIHRKLVFFQTTMGYSLSECRKILIKDPRLLMCSVRTGLIPRLNFLHKEVGISLPDIRKIALKNPRILRMSVEQNLTPKCIFYFIMTLQMQNKDVAKILLKYPQILDYNLEHHILPIHHYFLSLEFSTHEFSRILQRYPRLITYSLIRIKRRIGYLRFELSLEANAIRRIMYQCPQIISLGQENLEETVEFLLQTVAPGASLSDSCGDIEDSSRSNNSVDENYEDISTKGFTKDDLADADDRDALTIVQILVTGLPTLLPLSIEKNLAPKVEYLRERLGQEELSNALLRMPALLGYSLENRIRPRLEKIREAEIPVGKITVAITLREDLFDGWLERQIKKRLKNLQKIKSKGSTATAATSRRSTGKIILKPKSKSKTTKVPSPIVVADPPLIDEREKNNRNENLPVRTQGGDTTDGTKDKGGSRVVEEGGKIIHWRRR